MIYWDWCSVGPSTGRTCIMIRNYSSFPMVVASSLMMCYIIFSLLPVSVSHTRVINSASVMFKSCFKVRGTVVYWCIIIYCFIHR